MSGPAEREKLLRLAAKYVWWTEPGRVVSEGLPRLVTSVMELGTWEDAHELLSLVGPDPFVAVLDAPPAGVISDRSLAVWHIRLDRDGAPPRARRRFG